MRGRTGKVASIRVMRTGMTVAVAAARETFGAAWAPVPGVVSIGRSDQGGARRARYIG